MKDFDPPTHGIPTDLLHCFLKVAEIAIGHELPKDWTLARWRADLHRMDHRKIEFRLALLFSGRRADVYPAITNIDGHAPTLSVTA